MMNRTLHKALIKIKGNSGVRGLRLPHKRVVILNKVNKKTLEEFVEQLNIYLDSLLSNEDLRSCACVDAFFKDGAMNISTLCVCLNAFFRRVLLKAASVDKNLLHDKER